MKIKAYTRALFIVITSVENSEFIAPVDGGPEGGAALLPLPKSPVCRNEKVAVFERNGTLQPEKMFEREVKVLNKLGLHARPAAEFVRAARGFKCSVTIIKNGDRFSGSSILEVLSANLDCGSVMILRAEGPDAETAIERLAALMEHFRIQEEGEGI